MATIDVIYNDPVFSMILTQAEAVALYRLLGNHVVGSSKESFLFCDIYNAMRSLGTLGECEPLDVAVYRNNCLDIKG